MDQEGLVRPQISLLTAEQMEEVHQYSLRILSSVGVRVDSERARRAFAAAGAGVTVDGSLVRLEPELVAWAMEQAPATIEVFDREGASVCRLGDDRTRFGIGVTALYYQDPRTDDLVPFGRQHMAAMVRLGNALPHFDFISTVGIVQDVPTEKADLVATLEMVANTTKPLVVLISDEEAFPVVLDMLEHLHGDLAARPFVAPYFNPVTPLVMNAGTTDKMFAAIERGLPIIYSNYSMAGMSTPITPAGTLALMNAELLAGLALSQLIREGAAVILGSLPPFFDLKTMVSFYDPASFLVSLACAEMMSHYRIPHCGTSGSGTGWGSDLISADSYWMNELTACIGKSGLVPFVGDTLNAKAFSPTALVYVHEVIAQSLRFAEGFVLDEETVVLEEIAAAGPGGNFLTSRSTLKRYRDAYYESPIFPRLSMEKWQTRGQPEAADLLRDYTCALIESAQPPGDRAELLARGEAFIDARMARL